MRKIGLFSLLIAVLFCTPFLSSAQDGLPPLPSSIPDIVSKQDQSLADILKADLLRRIRNARENAEKNGKTRIRRPKPELGPNADDDSVADDGQYEPFDLSKYLGTEGDSDKTLQKLQDLGEIPTPSIPPVPSIDPVSATETAERDRWRTMPPEKRLQYANDLLERRKFEEGLEEIEHILDAELKGDALLDGLVLRDKFLLHNKHYDMVESDFFRLKSTYPKDQRVDALKEYIEKESGVKPLQDAVLGNPKLPVMQRKLLDQYLKYQWLDFAEEFFGDTIKDTSGPTIESLSEVYYRKEDFDMLANLSKAAQELYPNDAVHYYNQGVGLYNVKEFSTAKEAFQKARRFARTPGDQKRIDWYLERLKSVQ